jgi:hypothetical protein
MKVAVPRDQHSVRFGQRASTQTVFSRSPFTSLRVSSMSRVGMGRFNHGGSRRLGFSASTTGSDVIEFMLMLQHILTETLLGNSRTDVIGERALSRKSPKGD